MSPVMEPFHPDSFHPPPLRTTVYLHLGQIARCSISHEYTQSTELTLLYPCDRACMVIIFHSILYLSDTIPARIDHSISWLYSYLPESPFSFSF